MSDFSIFDVQAEYKSVVVKVVTSPPEVKAFYLKIVPDGIEFYDRVSSSGALEGNPIRKSASEIFEWISDDGPNQGLKKKFGERAAVQPKKGA